MIAVTPQQCISGLQPRQHRGLDTARIDPAIGPVTGQNQVVVTTFVRPQPVSIAAGQRLHVAIRRVDVHADVLGRQGLASSLTVYAAEQMPGEALFGDGVRKVQPDMLIEKSDGSGTGLAGYIDSRNRMVIRCGPRRVEAAAEVRDGARALGAWPTLGP